MNKFFVVLILSVGLLAGCSFYQIDSKDTTEDFYAPKKSIEEVAYIEKIEQPYQEIGVVTVTTERRQSLEDVLPKLRQEAAILGGDAITDIQTDATGVWKSVRLQKFLGNGNIRSNISAKVVVFK